MSFPIPKIQYKNTDDVNGFTASTTEVVLDSLSGVETGMFFTGPGVTIGTTIVAIDVPGSKVTLSQPITPTLGELFSWFFELEFRYPPESNDNVEESVPDQTISTSRSGFRQYLTRYIELERPLTFNFLTREEINFLKTMFDNWFSLGEYVRYFDDKTLTTFVEYQANDTKFKPSFIQGTSELYSLSIEFVRVK